MSYHRKLLATHLVATVIVFLLVAGFGENRWTMVLDDLVRSWFHVWSSGKDYGVVVVAIDEMSFMTLKSHPTLAEYKDVRWPWPPSLHGRLVNRLGELGADRIGFDILFSESYDQLYIPEYATAGPLLVAREKTDIPVVLAGKREQGILTEPLPIYLKSGFRTGLTNLSLSWAGDIRRIQYLTDDQRETFSLAIATCEGGDKNLEHLGWSREALKAPYFIRFRGRDDKAFPIVSYSDVLLDKVPNSVKAFWKKSSLSELFRGKSVLIGQTSYEAHDIHETPVGRMPGVLVHAHALEMLMQPQEQALRNLSLGRKRLLLAAILFLGLLVFPGRWGPSWPFMHSFFGIAYLVLAGWVFMRHSVILPLSEILLAHLANLVLCETLSGAIERREKHFISGVFGKYVSPSVARKLLADPQAIKLGGEEREITILFSDIVGFTTISETMRPHQLISLLNEYLGRLTFEIMSRDGTLDKYIGDAIMAFWGAPIEMKNHAELACRAALAMQEKSKEYNAMPGSDTRPMVNCRIGINTGVAVVGNAGSEQRFSYTAIGDAVNAASRFEGLGKKYGVSIILGEATQKQVDGLFDVRILDRVKVKGKTEAKNIYELMGFSGTADKAFLDLHQKAMEAYFNKDWTIAEKLFKEKLETYKDEQSSLILGRIEELKGNSVLEAQFDGSWALHEK